MWDLDNIIPTHLEASLSNATVRMKCGSAMTTCPKQARKSSLYMSRNSGCFADNVANDVCQYHNREANGASVMIGSSHLLLPGYKVYPYVWR